MSSSGGASRYPAPACPHRLPETGPPRASFRRRSRTPVPALVAAGLLAAAASAGAAPLRLDLPEVVRRARAESPLLRAAAGDIDRAGEKLRKARAARVLPEAKLTLGGGLVPEATGTVEGGGTEGGLDTLAPYYRAELKLVQPLWTFGRLDAAETLAAAGLAVERDRGALAAGNVALDAVRAYWALVAARAGETTADQMRSDFDKLVREVEERLADETSSVDDADLFRVRAKAFGIDVLQRTAVEARAASLDALRALLALGPEDDPQPVGEPPPAVAWGEDREEEIVAQAVRESPEVRALAAGLRALEAKVELQRRSRNPVLFVGAGAGYAHAGNRDEQDNPWASDNFNYLRVGAEVGLAFDLNLHRANLEVSDAEAERRALAERLAALRSGVGVEARRALRAARRAEALHAAVRDALRAAKSRLRLVLDNWETGLGEVDRVLDAYEDYYELKAEEPRRELDRNVALARLGALFGDINRYLGWVHDGSVRF